MAAPDRLGKYTLRGTLGRGAMGTVYDGWDPAIDRRVAIKTVKLSDADDEETAEALARFKREAQAAGRLSHPNIVGVYDYGETEDLAYIVMEFVEGRSLKSVIDQERRLPPPAAGTVMQQVLAGLAYSHARGVVHRDIKPANIMLTEEGQVKIADFGIARIESSSMTSVGTVMGTPAYMPPEQFLGEPVDARSDIYAAGVMLFHLLTGERPYEGSMTTIMQKVLNPEPPPLASARAAVPAIFDAVIAGAMAKAPAARYPNANAFSLALRRALDEAADDPESDATMVAPSRARPPAQDKASDATGLKARAPAEAAPVQAASVKAAAEAASPAKKGTPVALIGGIAAVLLIAAGGAWFALQPGAPKAVIPPPPVLHPANPEPATPPSQAGVSPPAVTPPAVTPPAVAPPAMAQAKPTPAEIRGSIEAALQKAACNDLAVTAGDGGAITLSGLVGEAHARDLRAFAEKTAGAAVAWSGRELPESYCQAIEILRAAASSPSAGEILPVTMNGVTHDVHMVDKAFVVPRVGLPSFPSWLIVDWFSNDGSFLQMYPAQSKAPVLQNAGSALTLTAKETGTATPNRIGPPFGIDLIIAVASGKPLLAQPRPDGETGVAHLSALAAAVAAARDAGTPLAAGYIVMNTSKMGR